MIHTYVYTYIQMQSTCSANMTSAKAEEAAKLLKMLRVKMNLSIKQQLILYTNCSIPRVGRGQVGSLMHMCMCVCVQVLRS